MASQYLSTFNPALYHEESDSDYLFAVDSIAVVGVNGEYSVRPAPIYPALKSDALLALGLLPILMRVLGGDRHQVSIQLSVNTNGGYGLVDMVFDFDEEDYVTKVLFVAPLKLSEVVFPFYQPARLCAQVRRWCKGELYPYDDEAHCLAYVNSLPNKDERCAEWSWQFGRLPTRSRVPTPRQPSGALPAYRTRQLHLSRVYPRPSLYRSASPANGRRHAHTTAAFRRGW